MNSKEMLEKICEVLSKRKAEDITILDVEDLTVLTDNYIICSGHSTTQVKALAEYVEEEMSKDNIEPIHKDGVKDGKWSVLDYGSIIVHIFHDEIRNLYSLEKLWTNKEETNIRKFS